MTFKETVIAWSEVNLETLESTLDDFIDEWHNSDSDQPLFDYLGMTYEEYSDLFSYEGGKGLIDIVKDWGKVE